MERGGVMYRIRAYGKEVTTGTGRQDWKTQDLRAQERQTAGILAAAIGYWSAGERVQKVPGGESAQGNSSGNGSQR
jgi:hypothetical protein